MEFIVKDVIISVLPLRQSSLSGIAEVCGGCTGCSDCSQCSTGTREVDLGSLVTNPANPAQLAVLKQQLREALAAVEAREQVVYEAMRPTSVTEIEILQSHLEAALEELRRSAAELQSDQEEESSQES
jgi:hypothetical protein